MKYETCLTVYLPEVGSQVFAGLELIWIDEVTAGFGVSLELFVSTKY